MRLIVSSLLLLSASFPLSTSAAPVQIDRNDAMPAAAGKITPIQQYKYKLCLGSDSGETDTCEIAFAPIPVNTRAEVTGVSCFVRTDGDVEIEYVQLLINKGKNIITAQTLQPELTSAVTHPVTQRPRNNFSVNNQVTAYAAAGQEVHFYIGFLKTEKKDNIIAYCHWSGTLISLK